MRYFTQVQIFRIFSANDWNQSELNDHVLTFSKPTFQVTSTFSSNAEKLRKSAFQLTSKSFSAPTRIIWSNGLIILFPLFPNYSKTKN